MQMLCRLIGEDGNPIYVNRDKIASVGPYKDKTRIRYAVEGSPVEVVRGTPEEVAFVINNGMTIEEMEKREKRRLKEAE